MWLGILPGAGVVIVGRDCTEIISVGYFDPVALQKKTRQIRHAGDGDET